MQIHLPRRCRSQKDAPPIPTMRSINWLRRDRRGGSITYTYDANGNLVKQSGSKNVDYSYDKENHLLRATIQQRNSVTIESYTYDYAGNRLSKTVNESSTTYYVNDTSGSLTRVVAEIDKDGKETASYIRGDELLSMERDGRIWYYIYDGHGKTRLLTNAAGTVTDRYAYDACGNLLRKEGDTENDFLYTGEQYNANTGLYYLRARYMDPSTGTFISMDSYQGSLYDPVSLHKYLYANANPVKYTDPTGYFSLAECSVANSIQSELNSYQTVWLMNVYHSLVSSLIATVATYNATIIINNVIDTMVADGFILENADVAVEKVEEEAKATTLENTFTDKRYTVYTLEDAKGTVRYVGRTNNYDRRMEEHKQPGGKMAQYGLHEGDVILTGLTKEQARGLEQSLIVLYHTQNFLKDEKTKYYNFVNGVGLNNTNKTDYYNAAVDYMNKYPGMFENFVDEELNAIKEDIGSWW